MAEINTTTASNTAGLAASNDLFGNPISSSDQSSAPAQPAHYNTTTEIQGIFTRQIYRKEDFVIGQIRPTAATAELIRRTAGKNSKLLQTIGMKGDASDDALVVGMEYKFSGRWISDPKYGEQFQFRAFSSVAPAGRSAVIKYLQQCKRIGPKAAIELWDAFGEEAVKILRTSPETAVSAVKRLSLVDAQAASDVLQKQQNEEQVRLDLMKLFEGQRIPGTVVNRLIKKYGDHAATKIKQNPFKLLDERGIGFAKADAIYTSLRLPKGRTCRQGYAAYYSIYDDRNGHTWYPGDMLRASVEKLIAGDVANPTKALAFCERMKLLASCQQCEMCHGKKTLRADIFEYAFGNYIPDPLGSEVQCFKCNGTGGKNWYALTASASQEERIARRIAQARMELPQWPQVEPAGEGEKGCTKHQADELAKSTGGMIGLFCGAPGTGKTFTIAQIVKLIIKQHGVGNVAICAPTGKAAVRCTELMHAHGASVAATTIHRLLKFEVKENRRGFFHNAKRPLPHKFLIVDETSMLADPLMADLLDACGGGTHVLFVGDINQLPPIDHGAPLRDFIRAKLPYGELRDIHRNAGTIIRACAAIRDGKEFETDSVIDLEPIYPTAGPSGDPLTEDEAREIRESFQPRNLLHINASKDQIAGKIINQIDDIRKSNQFDPVWDTQVIVALNEASPVARKQLNSQLQDLLNPAGYANKKWDIRQDDKVINTSNGFFTEYLNQTGENAWKHSPKEFFIANGEIGRVVGFDPKDRAIIEFNAPRRKVVIGRGTSEGDASSIELAYAVTCHKMQGSQAKVVIVALDPSPGAIYGVCSREWLFTAISRAEKLCYLVGTEDTAAKFCRRVTLPLRQTMLVERIAQFTADEMKLPPRPIRFADVIAEHWVVSNEQDDEANDGKENNGKEIDDEPTDIVFDLGGADDFDIERIEEANRLLASVSADEEESEDDSESDEGEEHSSSRRKPKPFNLKHYPFDDDIPF